MSNRYDVKWRRPGDPEVLECHGLCAEALAFRIRAVIRMCGSVEILELTPAGRSAGEDFVDFAYADGYHDGFQDAKRSNAAGRS